MRISEIFHSIQGEGVNAGKESTFVRFFGCNLSCSWCDTKYSWHPKFATFTEMKLQEILAKIQKFGCTHIIFTGGEPALFQKEILEIIQALPDDFTYEIESNGTIPLTKIEKHLSIVNISPKLKNSGCASKIQALSPEYFYKFVIVDSQDIPEILALVKEYDLQKVMLMPEGKRRLAQEQRTAEVQKLCKQYGFLFSPRLHVLQWNGRKGK